MHARTLSFFALLPTLVLAACGGQIVEGEPLPSGEASPSASSPTQPIPTGTSPAPSPSPTLPPAPSAPLSCPTKVTSLGGGGAIASSVALGAATFHLAWPVQGAAPELLAGTWNGTTHAVAARSTATRGTSVVEALSDGTWGASEGFSDSATRTVTAYRGLTRIGSFAVPNVTRERGFLKEGMSPDSSEVVYGTGSEVMVTKVVPGQGGWEKAATRLCSDGCELLWAKGADVLVVERARSRSAELVRRSFANLGGSAVRVADPTDGRAVVAVTANRIFLDGQHDRLPPIVLDRATLTPVPFAWDEHDEMTSVRERSDGSFDVFSIYSGEIATAKLVSAEGTVRRTGGGHAAYGQVTAGACGFWSDGRLFPFADAERDPR